MESLEPIGKQLLAFFETENKQREEAIALSRVLTRECANTIRAIHRQEWDEVQTRLGQVRESAQQINLLLKEHPDLYYAGYTQDALKEYVEASLTYALVREQPIPDYQTLAVIPRTYINGLSEAATELRRYILDAIRHDRHADAERLLDVMDMVYTISMAIDYPDAITGGLRRRTDTLRAVLERTLGELTMSVQQSNLEAMLRALQATLAKTDQV